MRKRENGKDQDTYDGGWKWYSKIEDEGLKEVSELAMGKKRNGGEGGMKTMKETEERDSGAGQRPRMGRNPLGTFDTYIVASLSAPSSTIAHTPTHRRQNRQR
ncbi:hypothetical protein K435DRAFT_857967 [Dendrothele bispora CBS 962.96]|uniref:Uncharacterized protein n=1 Tax=Dendrothele bispora (strain CBS 962.96) TaxID=1314807 RepID=A0A4S8M511_DENBC|nr:hypothetical protein K435DRAFT_857967 [Dendrothele bispora CBS 962.96]